MKPMLLLWLFCLMMPLMCKINLQRNIWVYWQTDIQKAPLLVRTSYEKLQIAAKNANWTLILVNGSTIKNHLKEYDRFEEVVKRGYRNSVQEKSDILRISLVEENGGVWVDFACILFDNLTWLSDQTQYQHLLLNKVGNNQNDPDMLMMGEGYHQSTSDYYNKEGKKAVDEYFGAAIHFLAAKKKSAIMRELKQKMYDNMSAIPYRQMVPQFNRNRFYFHYIDRPDSYYSGNLALESVIQKKQMQLDNSLTFGAQRQIAYHHYKVWMFKGEVGPIATMREHPVKEEDLFFETRDEMERRVGRVWFYLKAAKWLRDIIQDRQNQTLRYLEENKCEVKDILKSPQLSLEQCSLYFIVHGSTLHNLYNASKYEHQVSAIYMTLQQRKQLREKCLSINPSLHTAKTYQQVPGQLSQQENRILYTSFGNLDNFPEKLRKVELFLRDWWFNRKGRDNLKDVLVLMGIYVLCRVLAGVLMGWMGMRVMERGGLRQWGRNKGGMLVEVAVVGVRSLQIAVSMSLYQSIEQQARYPQYETTLQAMTIIIFGDLILHLITSSHKNSVQTLLNPQRLISLTIIPVYVPLIYSVFIHLDIAYAFAYMHTMTIGAGGIVVSRLVQEVMGRKVVKGFWVLRAVVGLMRGAKWVVLAVFGVFYWVDSSRFLMVDGCYVKELVSTGVFYVFHVSVVLTLLLLIFHLTTQLLKPPTSPSYNPNNTSPKQPTQDTHPTPYKTRRLLSSSDPNNNRSTTLHFLIMTITLSLFMYETFLTFDKALEAPSEFGYGGRFYGFLLVYVLLYVGMEPFGVGRVEALSSAMRSRVYVVCGYVALLAFPLTYIVVGGQKLLQDMKQTRVLLIANIIFVSVFFYQFNSPKHSQQSQKSDQSYEILPFSQEMQIQPHSSSGY